MKPMQSPKKNTWIICLVLAVIVLISLLVTIPVVTQLSPWIALVGLVAMLAATQLDNL